ncbi:hypothetical protein AACH10_12945 [Ideonella sp. DXS22W]|uniref:Uncharacterized protein n=1 Tax=Pseudaquabacterium inlustre TaxID=2984192 RepID=A0ABU9CJS3_9BURK
MSADPSTMPPAAPAPATAGTASLQQRLHQAMQRRLAAQLLPHEGQWLPAEEVAARQRQARRKAWIQAFELTLLALLLTLVSLVLLGILGDLVY